MPRIPLAAGAALVLAALCGQAQEASPRRAEAARMMGELMAGTNVGGDFALTDSRGQRFRLADQRGRYVLLYFGFTGCPDVCPTDLLAIGDALRELGPDAARVQPVFVTLDPGRDTRAVIGAYAANFHPRFVALTGSEAQVREVARLYKVSFSKVPLSAPGSYTIDHAAFTFLLGRDGKYIGYFPPGTPPERMAALVRDEIRKK